MANFTKMANQRAANVARNNRVIELDPKELMDDPENKEIYTHDDVTGLTEAMKEGGMFGVIMAYPYKGGYRIESGHRRKQAAIEAGLDKVPVLVTEPPKDDIERRKRLVQANLHLRNYDPMTYAREAEHLYNTFVEENKQLSAQGITHTQSPAEKAAANLEISASQVSRYRKLLKLPEKLQKLLEENPEMPWSAFADATELTDTQADFLYQRIMSEMKLYGESAITAKFVRQQVVECAKFKGSPEAFNREVLAKYELEAKEDAPAKKGTKNRRLNGATSIHKGCSMIIDSLDPSLSYIKEIQQENALTELKNLSAYLQEKIAEIEADGFNSKFGLKVNM